MRRIKTLLPLLLLLSLLIACSPDEGVTVADLERTRVARATEIAQEEQNAISDQLATLQRVAPEGTEIADPLPDRAHDAQVEIPLGSLPPMGGTHNPVWQNCEVYDQPIRPEHAVHSLEHGAVWLAYQPDLDQSAVSQLEELGGRTYMLVSPYPGLASPIVATAWGVQLQLESADDERLEQFVTAFRQGPQTPERGALCTGGTDETIQ